MHGRHIFYFKLHVHGCKYFIVVGYRSYTPALKDISAAPVIFP